MKGQNSKIYHVITELRQYLCLDTFRDKYFGSLFLDAVNVIQPASDID